MSKLNIKDLVTGARNISTEQPAHFVSGDIVVAKEEPQEVKEEIKEESDQ